MCALIAGLRAQEAGARPSAGAARLRIDAISRNPDNGAVAEEHGASGAFVGTRGQGKDVYRLRIGGSLPDGVELRILGHWGHVGDRYEAFGEWAGPEQVAGLWSYLRGVRLALVGPRADEWQLRYKAHLAWHGDTPWFADGEFLGTRGAHKYCLQGIQIDLSPRAIGPRRFKVVAPMVRLAAGEAPISRRQQPGLVFVAFEIDGDRLVKAWRTPTRDTEDGPAAIERTLKPGEMRTFVVIVVQDGGALGVPRRDIDSALGKALGRKAAGHGRLKMSRLTSDADRYLGGFTVIASVSETGRLSTIYGAIPQLAGRVYHDATSDQIAGRRAAFVELRQNCSIDMIVLLTDGL